MHDDNNMRELIENIVERLRHLEGPLLPILHAIQNEMGCVPPESVACIARALNLSAAEVHGVISFYHDFRSQPGGRLRVQICCAEACQARGARDLERHATGSLDLDYGQTSSDEALTLERVYCLGNCACGPSVRIGDEVFGRVDAARFDRLLATLVLEHRS